MARCTICGEKAGFLMSVCEPCIAKYQEENRARQLAQAEPVEQTCSGCGNPMEALGQLPLRTGGVSGWWHIIIGRWADMDEKIVKLDVFRCWHCKRVELFDLDLSIPRPSPPARYTRLPPLPITGEGSALAVIERGGGTSCPAHAAS